MEQHIVKIKSIQHLNHDVIQIVTEKPEGYTFTPGQATVVSINISGWEDTKRPFTFTSLPDSDFLEFTIKTYPDHKGVTNQLLKLKNGNELIVHEVFGAIAYKEEGVFIAGGAGVTPFISIIKNLHSKNKTGNNKLIFANKTKKDIFLASELKKILGENFISILSDEKALGHAHGFITEEFLESHIPKAVKNIYICGPPPMMDKIDTHMDYLKIDKNIIITEDF
ncbi:MAG: hypothetical protein PF481_00235 [Bacteroidales bacterium]|jgi:ferredoxin-NADP reductase|nr:hypothetical protein [Bacteroidales bacterium]